MWGKRSQSPMLTSGSRVFSSTLSIPSQVGPKTVDGVLGEAVGVFLVGVDAAGNDAVEVTAGKRRRVG